MDIPKFNPKIGSILFLAIILLSSCVTNKKIEYLQPVTNEDIPSYESFSPEAYRIQVGDELFISLMPYDADVSMIINGQGGAATTQLTTEASINLRSYNVDADGTILFPVIGKVKVTGLTTREIHELMDAKLKGVLYEEAQVIVKLVNKYVSLVGDFKRPGRYVIYKDQLNIFQAIAMGGDLTNFGNRTEIRIIRVTPEGQVVKTFDLRSEEIVHSEFFFVQPNDVIYASRIKGQFFQMDSFSDFLSTITAPITLLILVLNFTQN